MNDEAHVGRCHWGGLGQGRGGGAGGGGVGALHGEIWLSGLLLACKPQSQHGTVCSNRTPVGVPSCTVVCCISISPETRRGGDASMAVCVRMCFVCVGVLWFWVCQRRSLQPSDQSTSVYPMEARAVPYMARVSPPLTFRVYAPERLAAFRRKTSMYGLIFGSAKCSSWLAAALIAMLAFVSDAVVPPLVWCCWYWCWRAAAIVSFGRGFNPGCCFASSYYLVFSWSKTETPPGRPHAAAVCLRTYLESISGQSYRHRHHIGGMGVTMGRKEAFVRSFVRPGYCQPWGF